MYSSGQGSCHHGSALGRECEGMQNWISHFEQRKLCNTTMIKNTTTLRYNNFIWGCSTGRSSSLTRKKSDSTIDRQAHMVAELSAGLEEPHARHWPDKHKRHAGEFVQKRHAFQQTRMYAHMGKMHRRANDIVQKRTHRLTGHTCH